MLDETRLKNLHKKWINSKMSHISDDSFEDEPRTPTLKKSPRANKSEANTFSKFYNKGDQPKKKRIRQLKRRVNHEDVSEIGVALSMKFQVERLDLEEVYRKIMSHADNEVEISIENLKEALKSSPFDLSSEKEIELVARYLIEDNDEDKIVYDERTFQSSIVFKSVLRKFLNFYSILSEEDEDTVYRKIQKVLSDYYQRIMSDFAVMKPRVGEFCSRERLINIFRSLDLPLNSPEILSILVKCYEKTKDLNKIHYYSLFSLYDIDPPINQKQNSSSNKR